MIKTVTLEEKAKELVAKEDDGFKVKIAQPAPNFIVQMLDGQTIQLSELSGKVVMLNFWATWCAPCLMEFYDIPTKILEPFGNDDFVLLPISIGEPKERVAKKMEKLSKDGISFNVGLDQDQTIFGQYASGSIPKNILIDKNGNIQLVVSGGGDQNIGLLAEEIKKLLKK